MALWILIILIFYFSPTPPQKIFFYFCSCLFNSSYLYSYYLSTFALHPSNSCFCCCPYFYSCLPWGFLLLFILIIKIITNPWLFALVFSFVLIFIPFPFASCLCKPASKGRSLTKARETTFALAKARVTIRIKTTVRGQGVW